jgi:flagellar basal body-associated protein FliL
MSDEISYIPEPPEPIVGVPEKKKNKTLWIILAVVAVLLICCCLVGLLAVVLGFMPTEYDQLFYNLLPYLQLV